MPYYDYRCPECGQEEIVFHGMNEAPIVMCAKGHVENMMKKTLPRNFSMQFKGPGFYVNDYKGK